MQENFNQTKVRILKYIDIQKISIRKFSEKISISPSNFNEKNMKSSLSGDILSKILTIFSDINSDWLLLGKEPMLRPNAEEPIPSVPSVIEYLEKKIQEKEQELSKANREIGSLEERLSQERKKTKLLLEQTSTEHISQ